jgi:hypothetical protein
LITVGHPASAGRHRCICDTRRFLPRPPGPAEPLTFRHRAGGRAEALSRPSRSRSVTTAASRDGTAASPDPERLPSPGTPRGLHLWREAFACAVGITMLFAPAFTVARRRSTSGRRLVPPSLRTARHRLTRSAACHDSQAHPRAAVLAPLTECSSGACPGGHAPAEGPDSRIHLLRWLAPRRSDPDTRCRPPAPTLVGKPNADWPVGPRPRFRPPSAKRNRHPRDQVSSTNDRTGLGLRPFRCPTGPPHGLDRASAAPFVTDPRCPP